MSKAEKSDEPGLAARRGASRLLTAVLSARRPLDEAFAAEIAQGILGAAAPQDRAFARAIAATALRRLGEIDHVIARFMEHPLPRRAGPRNPYCALPPPRSFFSA